jgi:hypothetical protein
MPKADSKEDAFTLNTSVNTFNLNSCNELRLHFNVGYNLEDESSNMAVLEIELLSGYEPKKESLDKLKNNIALSKFSKHLKITNSILCFTQTSSVGISMMEKSTSTLTLSKKAKT